MKKTVSVLLCIILALSCAVFSGASNGTTYYIDSTGGNDANDGTSEGTAFRTVEAIRNIPLNPGDSVLFKTDGIYTCDRLTLTCSGTEDNPIVISYYGDGDTPLLTTNEKSEVLRLFDCSYVTVSYLEITAPNGGGIWIDTLQKESNGITLEGLTIHSVQDTKAVSRDSLNGGAAVARACVMVKGLPARSRFAVNNLTITDCDMYDCGNGVSVWGSWNDTQNPWCKTEDDIDPHFNKGILIKDSLFHNMDAEATIIGMCDGALVTNCRCIDCCLNDGIVEGGNNFCNAAMWFWGSINSTISHCEIAGQKCLNDGMTCDFDSYSHYCTYEYIYSHDNVRFVNNCPMYSGHKGNTIRYCLSVNDNVMRNSLSQFDNSHEIGLNFYNNTIINPSEYVIEGIRDGYIADNIFVGSFTASFRQARKNEDDEGNTDINEFTGTIKNNCFWGTCIPSCAEDNFICNPRFTGTDEDDPLSFRLSKKSSLLGKGITVQNGGEDIFGNQIGDKTNIGCYAGDGEDEYTPNVLDSILKFFSTAFGRIYQLIVIINNKYLAL